MKTARALGVLGELEAARAAEACKDVTTADLVVDLLMSSVPSRPFKLPDNPTWLGIDFAAPGAKDVAP